MRFFQWGLFLSLFYFTPIWAAQNASVVPKVGHVYESPSGQSSLKTEIAQGTQLRVSERAVRDSTGGQWYKVYLPTGEFGFMRVTELSTETDQRDHRSAALGRFEMGAVEHAGSPWTFSVRLMGLASLEMPDGFVGVGAEGELSSCLLLGARGYSRRSLALGVAYQSIHITRFLGASLIYRYYSESRWEPEFRLRIGESSHTDSSQSHLGLGLIGGARYPLELTSGTHFAVYAEGGVLAHANTSRYLYFFGSGGIGILF